MAIFFFSFSFSFSLTLFCYILLVEVYILLVQFLIHMRPWVTFYRFYALQRIKQHSHRITIDNVLLFSHCTSWYIHMRVTRQGDRHVVSWVHALIFPLPSGGRRRVGSIFRRSYRVWGGGLLFGRDTCRKKNRIFLGGARCVLPCCRIGPMCACWSLNWWTISGNTLLLLAQFRRARTLEHLYRQRVASPSTSARACFRMFNTISIAVPRHHHHLNTRRLGTISLSKEWLTNRLSAHHSSVCPMYVHVHVPRLLLNRLGPGE